MGFFDLFKKKQTKSTDEQLKLDSILEARLEEKEDAQTELTDEQLKWNRMWKLWTEEKTDSPYTELMTYQSEVNNGGHYQYFDNVANTSDLQKEMAALESVLPPTHKSSLLKAYQAYLVLEKGESEQAEKTLEDCDDMFYKEEEVLNRILEEYASRIEL